MSFPDEKTTLFDNLDNAEYGNGMSSKMVKSCFLVDGVCCQGEVDLVKKILSDIKGVEKDIVISLMDRMVFVTHNENVNPLELVNALNEKHLGASLKEIGEESIRETKKEKVLGAINDHKCFMMQVILFCFGVFLQVKDPECDFPCDLESWSSVIDLNSSGKLEIILYCIVLVLARKMFRSAWSSVITFRANADFLMSMAVIGSLYQGDVMSAALVALIVTSMDELKVFVFRSVKKKLQGMITPSESVVSLVKGEKINTNDLEVDMEFIVRAGEAIPCDGVVVKGSGQVDESRITGEAILVHKEGKLSSKVSSGSMLQSGFLIVKVEKVVSESFGSQINDAVSSVQATKTSTQEIIDKFAAWYTPIVVAIAVAVAAYQENLQKFLLIIVAGCPCALVGSSPLVYGISVGVLSKNHKLLIKSADSLNSLAKLVVVGFDKTGTVTNGEFKLIDMKCFKPKKGKLWTFEDVHRWAATVESADNHPLARSITMSYTGCVVAFAGGGELPSLTDFKRHGRCGVSGVVENRFIGVGNEDFLELLKVPINEPAKRLLPNMQQKGLNLFVVVDYELAAILQLSDTMKGDALQTIEELNVLNIKSCLLTGDKGSSVAQIANVIPFQTVYEGLLPQHKADWIQEQKKFGHIVGFVGDGLNDCIALASADIGISIQDIGSQATANAASAVLQGDIGFLPGAIIVARRVQKLVLLNIFLALFLNAFVILVAATVEMPLWLSVLADSGTLFIVLANSLWPLSWNLPPVGDGKISENALIEKFKPKSTVLFE